MWTRRSARSPFRASSPDDSSPALVRTRTRAHASRLGVHDYRLRTLTAERVLTRVRRGSYLAAEQLAASTAEGRHEVQIAAALTAQGVDGVVSHQSAAVLHGLPVWGCGLQTVHLTKPRQNSGRRSALLHVHSTPLTDDEIVEVGGVLVTSPARTVFDVACCVSFASGVVVADAALAGGLCRATDLTTAVERGRGRTGRSTARTVLAFADGRSESVGESRSRVGMLHAGLPAPDLQFEVRRDDGSLVGRSDFRWGRLLGEFDGLVKYGRFLRPGETAGDAVAREKRREDELRDRGCDMIRWGWADLAAPDRLYPRIRSAIERSAHRT